MITFATRHLQFQCDPEQAVWTVGEAEDCMLQLENARFSIRYRIGEERFQILQDSWNVVGEESLHLQNSAHGALRQVNLKLAPAAHGLTCVISFALTEQEPLFLWRVTLENQGSQPIQVERIEMLRIGSTRPKRSDSRLHIQSHLGELAFFSNGWQSWSSSGVYGSGERSRRTRLLGLQSPMCANPGTPQPTRRGHYSSDFFGVLGNRTTRKGFLAGFLSQQQHFGSLETWIGPRGTALSLWANGDGARLDPAATLHTDWAVITCLDLDARDPLGPYLEAVRREHDIHPTLPVPTGWCSWYQFYQKISAEQIEQNLTAMLNLRDRLPLELVQIDDGFESQVGDWSTFKPGFPEGVAPLARKIHAAGLTPGLWLAPFIVHPRSQLAQSHPEYLLRTEKGKPVNAGYVWDTFTTALDLTRPEALEAACRAVQVAAQEWGYPYLKLDFLYAGALAGQHADRTLTRAQVLRTGLEQIRAAVGADTRLLGCGVPLGSALGLFEAVRIGADVSAEWLPQYRGIKVFFKSEPHMPSVRNALQNILVRAPMHKRWWVNDPDCLLVRSKTRLSLSEVQSLATAIALTGGSLLLSDDLPALPEERLKLVEVLLPVIGERASVVDWFDAATPRRLRLDLENPAGPYSLLAYFNWDDQPTEVHLDLSDYGFSSGDPYFARSFWRQETYWVDWSMLRFGPIPAHGVVLLAVRPGHRGKAQYLGSSLHISQGMELAGWQVHPKGVKLDLSLPRCCRGQVDLYLPRMPETARLNNEPVAWEERGEGKYRFPVTFERQAVLDVYYG